MKKKLLALSFVMLLSMGIATVVKADDDMPPVDENGVPLIHTRGGIDVETREELGDNSTIGERLAKQREQFKEQFDARRQELENRVEEGRKMIAEKIQAAREEWSGKKDQAEKTISSNATVAIQKSLSARYTRTTEQLQNLTGRIEARMELLKQQGKDVSQAATELAAAKASMTLAQNGADAFLALGTNATLDDYKNAAQTVVSNLKDAKKHLQTTVKLLKGLSVEKKSTENKD